MAEFNREVLTLARESRGLTQADLSKLISIEQSAISKIENGSLFPSEIIIDSLYKALRYPKELFFQENKIIPIEGHYRKKISLPVKEQKEYKAKMTFTELHIAKLLPAVDLQAHNIPSWDIQKDGSPKDAAKYVRDYWKIPRGRINDLAVILENNGIIIAPLDLDGMDGFSTYSTQYHIPILFINRKRPADRTRFNLAHELCHYVCHFGKKISPERDVEKEANEFASELLIPSNEISQHLVRLSMDKLSDLKRYWKVSMQAILVKAKSEGIITPNQYKYLWQQMAPFRTKEPVEIPSDNICLLKELFQVYLTQLGYDKVELAKLLCISEEDLDSIYLGTRFKIIPLPLGNKKFTS